MLKQTQELCRLYGIKPARSKGQNFLINQDIYQQIVKIADVDKSDIILEVGPGLGFLTEALAKKAKQVIAVELDTVLAKALKFRLKQEKIENIVVVNTDILDWPEIAIKPQGNFKLVANLPYNITAIFLRKFLEADLRPDSMVLMLQKEVAERIIAKPGKMSLLAISVQFYSQPEIKFMVQSDNFWPQPKVDSAVIKIDLKPKNKLPLQSAEEIRLFFRLIKFGFSAKRKMLKNNLSAGLKISHLEAIGYLEAVGLSAKIRAQDLSISDWLKLFGQLRQFMI